MEDLRKSHDTCKTGNKQNTKQKNKQTNKQNTNTNDQRQVSLDGETSGEKVKRPKLSCVELHEEA